MNYYILSFLLLVSVSCFAQNFELGLTYSTGNSDMLRFQALEGDGSYDSEGYMSVGAVMLHKVNKATDLEIGFAYSQHNRLIATYDNPLNDPAIIRNGSKSIVAIPILARVHFGKYFFINPGVVLAFDDDDVYGTFDNQAGIGINFGLGVQYPFDFGLSVFANPYLRFYSTLSFIEKHPQHLTENGFRFGVTYSIPSKKKS